MNLARQEKKLPYSKRLITQEHHEVDFNQSDQSVRERLNEISNRGATPVDVFLAPHSQLDRVKKLSGKIITLTAEKNYFSETASTEK